MKKKAEKVKQSEKLKIQLATVSTVILSTFQGITVEQDTKLRRSVQAAGGDDQTGEKHGRRARRCGNSCGGLAEEPEGHQFDCVHQDGPGGAGENSNQSSKRCAGVSVSRRMGRGPRNFHSRDQPACFASKQGRANRQAHVPAERSGATHRNRAGRSSARFGGGHQRSSKGKQVRGSRQYSSSSGNSLTSI